MSENELVVKEKAQETTAVAPVSERTITDYLAAFGFTKKLNQEQQQQFVEVAKAFNLNPFKREIYCTPYKGNDGEVTLSIITGYEVYLKRAELHPQFDGYETLFSGGFKRGKITKTTKSGGKYDVDALVPDGKVICTCLVYRKDRSHPTRVEIDFDEYNQHNSMWQTKPRTMLEKVALAQAFRRAFPVEFGGMPYIRDEVSDDMVPQEMRDVTPAPAPEAPQKAPEATVTDPRDIPTAPTKRKATPEEIEKMAALARSFKPDELEYYKEEYNGDPAGMIEAMEKARIAKFEAGTLNQEPREERQHPWATPEQREALEKLAKETPTAETVGEKIPALYFEDDSKELYEK